MKPAIVTLRLTFICLLSVEAKTRAIPVWCGVTATFAVMLCKINRFLEFCNSGNVKFENGFCNLGMVEPWNGGMVEWWNDGMMEWWNDGMVEYWNDGMVE